jgi:hypothetical protein
MPAMVELVKTRLTAQLLMDGKVKGTVPVAPAAFVITMDPD